MWFVKGIGKSIDQFAQGDGVVIDDIIVFSVGCLSIVRAKAAPRSLT
jgi:hypothetical protein